MYTETNRATVLLVLLTAGTISAQVATDASVTAQSSTTVSTAAETSSVSTVSTQAPTAVAQDATTEQSLVSDAFNKSQIVPDYVSVAPKFLANTTFFSGAKAYLGKELTPTQVKDEPDVKWDGNDYAVYCIMMIDLDAPSRAEPSYSPLLHWQVVNIKADNLTSGTTMAQYIGAGPSLGSGLHRYVVLVYQQPSQLVFNETVLDNTSITGRTGFPINEFILKYSLTGPIAGNFFVTQYDSYVPILYKQIGLSSAAGSFAPEKIFLSFFVGLSFILYF